MHLNEDIWKGNIFTNHVQKISFMVNTYAYPLPLELGLTVLDLRFLVVQDPWVKYNHNSLFFFYVLK